MHKPIYHADSDVGDHVVVFNTRKVALRGPHWRTATFHSHTRRAGGYTRMSSWRVHEMDPTRIMERAVYSRLSKMELEPKKLLMARLHLFPDDEVPENMLGNVSGQIRQVMAVSKKLEDYSQEEIDNFPRLFELPEDLNIESYQRELQQEPDMHTTKKNRIEKV